MTRSDRNWRNGPASIAASYKHRSVPSQLGLHRRSRSAHGSDKRSSSRDLAENKSTAMRRHDQRRWTLFNAISSGRRHRIRPTRTRLRVMPSGDAEQSAAASRGSRACTRRYYRASRSRSRLPVASREQRFRNWLALQFNTPTRFTRAFLTSTRAEWTTEGMPDDGL